MTPYSVINIKKSASKLNQDSDIDGNGQDEENEEEVEEDEDITGDAMIKKVRYLDSLSYSATNSSSPSFPITSPRMCFLFPTFSDSNMASM
jgi:hypothetical protein